MSIGPLPPDDLAPILRAEAEAYGERRRRGDGRRRSVARAAAARPAAPVPAVQSGAAAVAESPSAPGARLNILV